MNCGRSHAYFHIIIHTRHMCVFCFALGNNIYQSKVLTFGLSIAPRIFTKCMGPLATYLRLHCIIVFPHIDNWLIVTNSMGKAERDVSFTIHLLMDLDLHADLQKSKLKPDWRVQYIARLHYCQGLPSRGLDIQAAKFAKDQAWWLQCT